MLQNRKTAYAEAVAFLRRAVPEMEAVYLFGSQASEETHPESDADLAVLAEKPLPPETRLDVRAGLARVLRAEVDLIDLRTVSTVMQMQALRTGRLLYERDTAARQHFETYVYSAYALLNEERRAILDDIRQRGRVYG